MNQAQAKEEARTWWGDRGSVEVRGHRAPFRYVVGTSTLSSRLGGRVSDQFGASWKSFEMAFADATRNGHPPTTGFEVDEAIEDEA